MSPLSQPVPVCLFMVVVLLVPAMSLEKRYSNSWAVEVKGGQEVAEQLARKHGFINHGQVPVIRGNLWVYGERPCTFKGGHHYHQDVNPKTGCVS